ncbi:MAG: hypothetical protein WC475_01710 [Candidatus Paceibacterota bacterium]
MEKRKDENGVEVVEEATLAIALSNMLVSGWQNKKTYGLDKARSYNRIKKALEDAETRKKIELLEPDFLFMEEILKTEIPGIFGFNVKAFDAIEAFLKIEPKEEKKK